MPKKQILGVDPTEKVITEIRKHPVGLLPIYLSGTLVIIFVLTTVFILASGAITAPLFSSLTPLYWLLGAIAIGSILVTFIAAEIYTKNEIVITNENLIQIIQTTIFDRKVSQLNLAKVQDVSVDQDGFFAMAFSFGTLSIETAGEAANFRFKTARQPFINAKEILEAHERYVETNPDLNRL